MAYNPLGSNPGGPGYDPNQQNRPLGSRPGMVGSDTNNPWNFGEKIAGALSGIKDRFGFGTDAPQTKTFDPSDKKQVGEMQNFLNQEGYRDSEGNELEQDSMFGPKTQAAYRNYVNDQRIEQGLEPYKWENNNQPMENVNLDYTTDYSGESFDPSMTPLPPNNMQIESIVPLGGNNQSGQGLGGLFNYIKK